MMLKSFKVAVLSSSLVVSLLGIATAQTLPAVQSNSVQSTVDDRLVCYMQTSSGTVLNLNNLCGRNASSPNRQITVSDVSVVPEGLIPYSSRVNGVTCVMFDQQGRPCVAQ